MKKTGKNSFINRKDIQKALKESKRPLSQKELEKILRVGKAGRKTIRNHLKDLLREGSVIMLKSGLYGIPTEMNLKSGTLWCTRNGNGFLISEKDGEKAADAQLEAWRRWGVERYEVKSKIATLMGKETHIS